MREPDHQDDLSYRVTELFLEGLSAQQIADRVNKERNSGRLLSRESVYSQVRLALKKGYIRLSPPLDRELSGAFCSRFGLDPAGTRIVNTPPRGQTDRVSVATAEWVIELAKAVPKRPGKPVALGLGPGRSTLEFSLSFASLMQSDLRVPKLRLFALTAGGRFDRPEVTPVSFFNVFPAERVEGSYGLFAETVLRVKAYKKVREQKSIDELFRKRHEIDIVVTSMGDMKDARHDLLSQFLEQAGDGERVAANYVGNVQYRPYDETGPAPEDDMTYRAFTLFELSELREMAQTKHKHVVLMVRPCGECGRTRARALLPLLQVPELRVFSELVIDTATAREVLEIAGSE